MFENDNQYKSNPILLANMNVAPCKYCTLIMAIKPEVTHSLGHEDTDIHDGSYKTGPV